ncbi:MAG: hypothetical protein KDB26_16280 [Microthrixaceae bacterium]|nr:hypothetical protein [Microthrixaceae bacterium]
MKLTRALGLSAIAATVLVSGCTSTVVEGRAVDDGKGCKISRVTMQCIDGLETGVETTSPTAAPRVNPSSVPGGVQACDGSQCSFSAGDDEVSLLVSESLTDVWNMWNSIGAGFELTMYKNGIGNCDGNSPSAAAWVCPSTSRGGWSPAVLRSWAEKRGATLRDTVRATVAHEAGHMVLEKYNNDSDDLMTNELRADCMAGIYSKWSVNTEYSAMGELPLSVMQRVLYGSKSKKAIETGFYKDIKDCAEYTP